MRLLGLLLRWWRAGWCSRRWGLPGSVHAARGVPSQGPAPPGLFPQPSWAPSPTGTSHTSTRGRKSPHFPSSGELVACSAPPVPRALAESPQGREGHPWQPRSGPGERGSHQDRPALSLRPSVSTGRAGPGLSRATPGPGPSSRPGRATRETATGNQSGQGQPGQERSTLVGGSRWAAQGLWAWPGEARGLKGCIGVGSRTGRASRQHILSVLRSRWHPPFNLGQGPQAGVSLGVVTPSTPSRGRAGVRSSSTTEAASPASTFPPAPSVLWGWVKCEHVCACVCV